MPDYSSIPRVKFSFSAAALVAIEDIRADWKRQFPGEDPDIVCVAWGTYTTDDGRMGGKPVVTFYTKAQRDEIAPYTQRVSGLEVLFFTIPDYLHHFEDKVLDFSKERFFFLRQHSR